ncbi:Kinesin-like protein [Leptomonas pyrrhocoris]|uniref:Kinesin-like protein n=1 Tax=Leptomonas pyrrhocoris TaxID=157538 RepID=A0A0M9G2K1_LEPPY|nr:Kinesin-like protein [Leptomonas pyrrhocoris]KPA80859.1 Kinesin-like protein [Leptomonas pyrrhocoris]|eukprot:XP_015659298.1 Kinesin-like protein [Leptomonas pyrrhocoris]
MNRRRRPQSSALLLTTPQPTHAGDDGGDGRDDSPFAAFVFPMPAVKKNAPRTGPGEPKRAGPHGSKRSNPSSAVCTPFTRSRLATKGARGRPSPPSPPPLPGWQPPHGLAPEPAAKSLPTPAPPEPVRVPRLSSGELSRPSAGGSNHTNNSSSSGDNDTHANAGGGGANSGSNNSGAVAQAAPRSSLKKAVTAAMSWWSSALSPRTAEAAKPSNVGVDSKPPAVLASTTAIATEETADQVLPSLSSALPLHATSNANDNDPNGDIDLQGDVSVEWLSLGGHQASFCNLESPRDATFLADLGVFREGVDWEQVDADPRELLHQRNMPVAPVITCPPAKSNDETGLNRTRNTITPEQPSFLLQQEAVAETVADAAAAPDVVTTEKVKESAEDDPPAAPAILKEGEANIFVAVRLRPCSSEACGSRRTSSSSAAAAAAAAGGGGVGASGNSDASCVHADARRGFVDCSTPAPASLLGGGIGSNGTAAFALAPSAGAGTVAAMASLEKSDPAAGKRTRTLRFFFDHILDERVTQRDVMEHIGQRAVAHVLAGYHGTVMCYGQSGSGKTYTIVGPNGGRLAKKALRWRGPSTPSETAPAPEGEGESSPAQPCSEGVQIASEVGLLPRMLLALFRGLEAQRVESDKDGAESPGDTRGPPASWRVTFSALELYNEELRDLLPHAVDAKRATQTSNTAKAVRRNKAEDAPLNGVGSSNRGEDGEDTAGEGEEEGGVKTATTALAGKRRRRAGLPNGSPATIRSGEAATSAGFLVYPGLLTSTKGGTSKTRPHHTHCWNEEDLDVLNAVSSSDDESEAADGEEYDDSGSEGTSRNSSSEKRTGMTSTAAEHARQQRDVQDGPEPEPSRPTTNGEADAPGSVSGRETIGQLTSVSPSPPRRSDDSNGSGGGDAVAAAPGLAPAKKRAVVVVDLKANNYISGDNTKAKSSTALRTRIARRLPNSTASKSPSPLQKLPVKGSNGGLSAGSPTGSRPGPRTPTIIHKAVANRRRNRSASNNSAGPLVIRQGQPPASPTVNASTAAAAAASFAYPTTSSVRSTSAKPHTVTRPPPRRRRAVRSAEGAVYIEGLREHPIRDLHEAMRAVRRALHHRQMASTELNSDSSRAHTFFFIHVEQRQQSRRGSGGVGGHDDAASGKTADSRAGKLVFGVRRSTLTLVDLAGSERVSHTGAHGLRLTEAQSINLSLSALGNVMRVLSSAASLAAATATAGGIETHIPYRDSKLTRLLQSSLGGNAITFLLCNVSPDHRDAAETMSTLRFAKLSKTVKNKAKLNESIAVEDDAVARNGKTSKAVAALVESCKKEQQAALAAVLAAESKMNQLVADAALMQSRMQQMATYTWWLEEQLGHFASARDGGSGAIRSGSSGDEPPARYPGVTVAATAAAPTSLMRPTGDVCSGEGDSSVGPLSDTERVVVGGGGGGDGAALLDDGRAAEKLSDSSSWWRLSPRPSSPPPTIPTTTAAAASGVEDGNRGGPGGDVVKSTIITAAAAASLRTSLSSPFTQYWQSPPVRAFFAPSYSLRKRQRTMQQRLIAAAAVAGLTYSPALPPPLTSEEDAQATGAQAASSQTPVSWSAPLAFLATLTGGGRGTERISSSTAAPTCTTIPLASVPEGFRAHEDEQQRLTDPSTNAQLHNTLNSSAVFVSASSLAGMNSPSSSTLTDALPTQSQQSFQLTSPLTTLPSMVPSAAVSTLPQRQHQQPSWSSPVSNFAAAFAEERRIRATVQGRLGEVEQQNLFLRLLLSSLQQQQQKREESREDPATDAVESRSADASTATGVANDRPSVLLMSPSCNATASPQPLPPLQWPPHYSRVSGAAALDTFVARCGFLPLEAVAAGAAFTLPATQAPSPPPHLATPADAPLPHRITVDPLSVHALREGSAAREVSPWNDRVRATAGHNSSSNQNAESHEEEEEQSAEGVFSSASSSSVSSVLAVVNASMNALRGELPLISTPVRPTTSSIYCGRGSSSLRRSRAMDSPDSPDASPGWGQQLLDSVRTTVETVRAMSLHETFYDPEDINASA